MPRMLIDNSEIGATPQMGIQFSESVSASTQELAIYGQSYFPSSKAAGIGRKVNFRVSEFGVALHAIQTDFSSEKQSNSTQPAEGSDLLNWLGTRNLHGPASQVSKLTGDNLKILVKFERNIHHSNGRVYELFRTRLLGILEDESIEDGVAHSAEFFIKNRFQKDPVSCLDTLASLLQNSFEKRPSIAASLLRCIGRMRFEQVGHWGLETMREALVHNDVEVRDAAIRALEKWGGDESVRILQQHRDREGWVNDYVAQVILDLSQNIS